MENNNTYEWNEAKRQATLLDRGVDFADIAKLDWHSAITAEDARFNYAETRFITLGKIDGRLHVAVWCWADSNIRVISFRKANKRERKHYEETG